MHPLLSVPLPRLLVILALTLLQVSATLAAGTRKNVTVDDTNGSSTGVQIAYSPPGAWSVGQNCTACQAKLDKSQAFDGSWHDVSFISDNPPPTPISASLTFDGVGVYAFCVITRSNSDPNGNWDLSFLIDGEQSGTFKLAPDGDATYHYNVPVYANDSLASGKHTFTMVVGHPGGQSSIALLDYMIFTQEDDAPTTTSSSISESSSPSSAPHSSSAPNSSSGVTTSTLPIPTSPPSSHSGASSTLPTPVSTTTTSVSTLTSASSVTSVLSSGVSSATSAAGSSSATNPAGGLSSAGSSPSASPSSNSALGMLRSGMGARRDGVVGAGVALIGVGLGVGLVF
ncbi:uncharacterized protein TRAVEDRAFT_66601 [Trametes versicolor FP-101664 SS1]|uniref:uncharacterized protein n=1 Tax=Trametes versicolor (strain FP-101664) TaxID=717944 RepID=UPI0004623BA4|nr:uncharacterized protein TRAVEDRAFT_66601 [Trametes versicolor FP-101664 SS1]EIW53837.1 hypothetical protein TRAVEDRAFT_66601 [Trametes versicolor FP-101664 SS1]